MTFTLLNAAELNATNGGYVYPNILWQDTRPIYQVIRDGKFMLTRDFNQSTDKLVLLGSAVSGLIK